MGSNVSIVIGGSRRDPICLCREPSHSFLVVVCEPKRAWGHYVQSVSRNGLAFLRQARKPPGGQHRQLQ